MWKMLRKKFSNPLIKQKSRLEDFILKSIGNKLKVHVIKIEKPRKIKTGESWVRIQNKLKLRVVLKMFWMACFKSYSLLTFV